MKDYYYILGIESNASENEVKKAYRKLSTKFHPDKNKGDKFFEDRFKEIQEAYETLSNQNKRRIYDSKLRNENSDNRFSQAQSKKKENPKTTAEKARNRGGKKGLNIKSILLIFGFFAFLFLLHALSKNASNKPESITENTIKQINPTFNSLEGCYISLGHHDFKLWSTKDLISYQRSATHKIHYKKKNQKQYYTINERAEIGNSDYQFNFDCSNIDRNIVFEDFNFDGRTDFAIISGASPYDISYNFYVQNEKGQYQKDEFLSYDIGEIPKINKAEKIISTDYMMLAGTVHAEIQYKFNSLTNEWSRLGSNCLNCPNLVTGITPYYNCLDINNVCNSNCSKIKIITGTTNDVIVTIKENDRVVRHAFIQKNDSFVFELPNGTYQTFFYSGQQWMKYGFINNPICDKMQGRFFKNESFSKGKEQNLYNQELTYELYEQINGNFKVTQSNESEFF